MNISPSTRNAGLYLLGVTGIIVETAAYLLKGIKPDPSLSLLFAGCLGLPGFLKKDESDP